jgi:molybdenum-dependent DNA-binding transcriptional regulator ModE
MAKARNAIDPKLKKFATDRQAETIDAVNKAGSIRAAAKMLGIDHAAISRQLRAVQVKAARLGYAPGHFEAGTAPGYRMGKVTVQRTPAGIERVWERQHPDEVKIRAELEAFAANVVDDIRGMAPLISGPEQPASHLLGTYWFGDPHFGLGSNADDGGEDTDIEEADRLTRAGIDALVSHMPQTERAILGFIGDNLHANDGSALTPHGRNPLDIDPRGFGAAFLACSRAIAYATARALCKHQNVEVWILPGNHDPDAAFAVAVAVSMFFDNEPRVTVRLSRDYLWSTVFGKNLIAACHGDKIKPMDVHGVLSNDCRDVWHQVDFRYVWFGHIHHDTVTEYQGTRLESLRTLAKSDAWHRGKGYRSMRDTRAVLYHADGGEAVRFTVSAAMLREHEKPARGVGRLGLK